MDKTSLKEVIISSEKSMDLNLKEIWESIKIEPELWTGSTGSFWIVAILEDEIIWYNHNVKGFNISKFNNQGEITEYWEETTSLSDLLWHLF